jgi:uncharacterized integral membrane protein
MRLARRLFALLVFVALLVVGWQFAARNAQPIVVQHPAGEFQAHALWMILLVAFAAGVVLTTLVATFRGAQIRLVSRRYRKLADSLQAEVHQLRSLPLSDERQTQELGLGISAGLERGS